MGSPDLHKLGRVLIQLAEAQAEKDAQVNAGRSQSTAPEEADDGDQ